MTPPNLRRYPKLPGNPLSVTTILSLAFPQPNLIAWKIRESARLARKHPNEPDAGLLERHKGPGATRGTTVHKMIDRFFRWDPHATRDLVAAEMFRMWAAWWHVAGISWEASEFTVLGPGYAGTADFLGARGVLADWKTCTRLPAEPYPDHVAQLWAYAQSKRLIGSRWAPLAVEMPMVVYISPEGVAPFVVTEEQWDRGQDSWGACLALARALWPEIFYPETQPERNTK
jgi:hypothetical protein